MVSSSNNNNNNNNNTNENTIRKAPPYFKAVCGSIGGFIEACCLQPVDTVKTRLQLNPLKYRNVFQSLTLIGKEEGTLALWKGLTPFSTHLVCKYALRFGTNAKVQSLVADENGKLDNKRRILAGLIAGMTEAIIIVTPFEVIKINLQAQAGLDKNKLKYKGPIDLVSKLIKSEGPFALWKGGTPTICRNGLNQASMFITKTKTDGFLWGKFENDGKILLPWQSMISGFCAGVPGMILTNPFDIVKTRLMVQEKGGERKYKHIFDALIKIPKEEGILTLYKGLSARLMRVPPGMAITWMVADQIVGRYERNQIF